MLTDSTVGVFALTTASKKLCSSCMPSAVLLSPSGWISLSGWISDCCVLALLRKLRDGHKVGDLEEGLAVPTLLLPFISMLPELAISAAAASLAVLDHKLTMLLQFPGQLSS